MGCGWDVMIAEVVTNERMERSDDVPDCVRKGRKVTFQAAKAYANSLPIERANLSSSGFRCIRGVCIGREQTEPQTKHHSTHMRPHVQHVLASPASQSCRYLLTFHPGSPDCNSPIDRCTFTLFVPAHSVSRLSVRVRLLHAHIQLSVGMVPPGPALLLL